MRNFAITAITAIGFATAAAALAYTAQGGHGGAMGGYAQGGFGRGAFSPAVSDVVVEEGGDGTSPGSAVTYDNLRQQDVALWMHVHGHAVPMDDVYAGRELPSGETTQR